MVLHWSNEITYILWVKNGGISSAHNSALIQQDHVQTVGETWGDAVSTRFCIDPTRSRNLCGEKQGYPMSTWFCIDLTRSPTLCGWKTGKFHQYTILHQSKIILLSVGEKRGDPMSIQFCIDPTRSCTLCGWKTGRSHQHMILHRSNEITYFLWVKHGGISSAHDSASIQQDHIRPVGEKQRDFISTQFYIDPTRSRTSCGGKTRKFHEHTILHWSNQITYILLVKNREIPSTHDSASIQRDHVLSVGEKRGDPISTWFFIDPTRSRTFCRWNMGRFHQHTILSASIQQDHVLSVGKKHEYNE